MGILTDFESAIAAAQRASLQKFGVRTAVDVLADDEPIDLLDAYDHLRIFHDSNGSDDDAWLSAQIPAAREYCERELGCALAARTLELATNAFPAILDLQLPFGPVRSVTSITYRAVETDSNGDTVLDSNGDAVVETRTVDAATYELDNFVTPNRLVLAYGKSWPSDALDTINSVKVRYVVGYVPEAESNGYAILPRAARSAMLLMLAHLYENREATGPNTLASIPHGVMAWLELVPGRERMGMA